MGGIQGGPGLIAPPGVKVPSRSYASVASGGIASSSSGTRDGDWQQRLTEALRRGERSIMVEGKEVSLSFWRERHGLGAFQDDTGGAPRVPPTTGQEGPRRNVVRLQWIGEGSCPLRPVVVTLLLEMKFKAEDIFALIHPYGSSVFDVSFVRPEGLELFWANYELVKGTLGWQNFRALAVSRQNDIKRVTVLTYNESLSCFDIVTWLCRYGELKGVPEKIRDQFGIWSGAWTLLIKLKRSGNTVAHIPSATFLGIDRIQVFYRGQPKVCHRCGDPTHFSANCSKQVCSLCRGEGHLAASCRQIRCDLCFKLGHPFSRCPDAYANRMSSEAETGREARPADGASGEGQKQQRPVKNSASRQRQSNEGGRMVVPRVSARENPNSAQGDDLQTEALGDVELDEEVERIIREEAAGRTTVSTSSRRPSASREDSEWLEQKKGKGKDKKSGKETLQTKIPKSPTGDPKQALGSSKKQISKEGLLSPPMIEISNRFGVLGGEEEGTEGLLGVAEPLLPGITSREGGVGLVLGDEDAEEEGVSGMDTSKSLKRDREEETCASVESVSSFPSVDGVERARKKAI